MDVEIKPSSLNSSSSLAQNLNVESEGPPANMPSDEARVNLSHIQVKPKSKKRKSKVLRDETAPRQPLTGYVRYLNERRDALRAENPGLNFAEMTRQLASEWGKLSAIDKQHYLDAAEQDKERYLKEWAEYKKTDAFKEFRRQQLEQKEKIVQSKEQTQRWAEGNPQQSAPACPTPPAAKKAKVALPPAPAIETPANPAISAGNAEVALTMAASVPVASALPGASPPRPKRIATPSAAIALLEDVPEVCRGGNETDIPIFTEQFLQHNKLREMELRQLRSTNTDYEQQNAILQKHVEEVQLAAERLRGETARARERVTALRDHYEVLCDALLGGLAGIALPGGLMGATRANLEQYMDTLSSLAAEGRAPAALRQARDFIATLEVSL